MHAKLRVQLADIHYGDVSAPLVAEASRSGPYKLHVMRSFPLAPAALSSGEQLDDSLSTRPSTAPGVSRMTAVVADPVSISE